MIQRSSYLLYIAIFSFACVVILASTFSLWFLRGVVGSQQGVFELGLRGAIVPQIAGSDNVMKEASSHLGFSLYSFNRLVYVQDRSWEYVVGIPMIKNQVDAPRSVESAGWSTSRIGWIIIGKRAFHASADETNTQRNISLLSGLRSELSAVFVQHLPANPVFFVRTIPGFKSIEGGAAAYGDSKKGELHMTISYSGSKFLENRTNKVPMENEAINDFNVTIQSELLQLLPKDFLSVVTSNIAARFHFIKTSPTLFASISSNDHIGILMRDGNTAIGVHGNAEQFIASVAKYIQFEQGARHPQRKGFLLPDKTLGHEYVPSSPRIRFEKADDPNCEKADGYDEQLFVCKDSTNVVAVGTSLGVAQNLVQRMKGSDQQIRGSITGDVLENFIPKNIFQNIVFVGDANGANIWASY